MRSVLGELDAELSGHPVHDLINVSNLDVRTATRSELLHSDLGLGFPHPLQNLLTCLLHVYPADSTQTVFDDLVGQLLQILGRVAGEILVEDLFNQPVLSLLASEVGVVPAYFLSSFHYIVAEVLRRTEARSPDSVIERGSKGIVGAHGPTRRHIFSQGCEGASHNPVEQTRFNTGRHRAERPDGELVHKLEAGLACPCSGHQNIIKKRRRFSGGHRPRCGLQLDLGLGLRQQIGSDRLASGHRVRDLHEVVRNLGTQGGSDFVRGDSTLGRHHPDYLIFTPDPGYGRCDFGISALGYGAEQSTVSDGSRGPSNGLCDRPECRPHFSPRRVRKGLRGPRGGRCDLGPHCSSGSASNPSGLGTELGRLNSLAGQTKRAHGKEDLRQSSSRPQGVAGVLLVLASQLGGGLDQRGDLSEFITNTATLLDALGVLRPEALGLIHPTLGGRVSPEGNGGGAGRLHIRRAQQGLHQRRVDEGGGQRADATQRGPQGSLDYALSLNALGQHVLECRLGFRRSVTLLQREGEGVGLTHHGLTRERFHKLLPGGRQAVLASGGVAVSTNGARDRLTLLGRGEGVRLTQPVRHVLNGFRYEQRSRYLLNPSGAEDGEKWALRGTTLNDAPRADSACPALCLLAALLLNQGGGLANRQAPPLGDAPCPLLGGPLHVELLPERAGNRDEGQLGLGKSQGDRGGGVSLTRGDVSLRSGLATYSQGFLCSRVAGFSRGHALLTLAHGVDLPLDQNRLVVLPSQPQGSGPLSKRCHSRLRARLLRRGNYTGGGRGSRCNGHCAGETFPGCTRKGGLAPRSCLGPRLDSRCGHSGRSQRKGLPASLGHGGRRVQPAKSCLDVLIAHVIRELDLIGAYLYYLRHHFTSMSSISPVAGLYTLR